MTEGAVGGDSWCGIFTKAFSVGMQMPCVEWRVLERNTREEKRMLYAEEEAAEKVRLEILLSEGRIWPNRVTQGQHESSTCLSALPIHRKRLVTAKMAMPVLES